MSFKILFMGTPEFSVPILKKLNLEHKIIGVITQPPKKKYRGKKLLKSPVHIEAEKLNIPIRHPDNLDNNIDLDFIKNTEIDFVIVVAYGQIIPNSFLNIKNLIFLNIHASLLPRWRGAAPIQRSIMEMDTETGISIMKIIPKLDAGPYMLQEKITINERDNFSILSKSLSEIGSNLILDALNLFKKDEVNFINQDEKKVTYAKKINKKEAKINWNKPARKIIAEINGLNPFPGAWFEHNGNRIKIIEAEKSENTGREGEVLTNDLIIGCKDKSIKIKLIQKEGRKILKIKDFLTGYEIKKGEILS